VPCRHDTWHDRAVPARHGAVPRRAAVPCQTVLWARPSAHDTAHGSFTRAVPPVSPRGHGARVRARRAAVEGEGARRPWKERRGGEAEKMRAEAKEMRSGGGDARRGGEVWPCRPCRAKAVSWARPAAHDPHGPSCRAGTGTLPVVPYRPWAVPKGRAVGRAAGPWAVCTSIGRA
jgi:hypothetical protein